MEEKRPTIVAMDMANAYSSWIEKHFPKTRIVFDHFHVIKLMNERLDKLRRRSPDSRSLRKVSSDT